MKNIVLVTGASSGLGFEIANELVKKGHHVCILGRNEVKLEEAKSKLLKFGQEVVSYALDVSNEKQVNELMNKLKQDYVISHLFNVAGVGVFGKADSFTRADIDRVLSANLIGLMLVTTAFLRNHKAGRIINVMSTAAKVGKENEAIYCASKFGARGYTESLKRTYKGSDIKVIAIYPGGMATPFWQDGRDTSQYLSAKDVARQTVDVALDESLHITELTIERN